MSKQYNNKSFYIEMPDGRVLTFHCWTTDTRNGFCHTVWCYNTDQTTKVSYWNRTWESYDYQTALLKAFDKLHKEDREFLRAWDADKVAGEHARCEAFIAEFKKSYDEAPKSVKESLAKSDITLNSEADANAMLGFLKVSSILGD